METQKNSIPEKQITVCACASRTFIDKDKISVIAAALSNHGYHVTIKPDLCRLVMQASPEMPEIAAGTILACYPRTVHSHLHGLGLTAGRVIDMRSNTCGEVLASFNILSDAGTAGDAAGKFRKVIDGFPPEPGSDAWYPVIDKTRCTECGKCHDFCLFGVYRIENKKVRVAHPENCKNNCPACARMCPSRAIIFPKYEKSPVNGGTAEEETFNPEEMDRMYRERLQMRLRQRRAGVSMLKESGK